MARAPDGVAAEAMREMERQREQEQRRRRKPTPTFTEQIATGGLTGVHFTGTDMVEQQRLRFVEEMATIKKQETLDSIADLLSAVVIELREIRSALPNRRK